jgi:integrase
LSPCCAVGVTEVAGDGAEHVAFGSFSATDGAFAVFVGVDRLNHPVRSSRPRLDAVVEPVKPGQRLLLLLCRGKCTPAKSLSRAIFQRRSEVEETLPLRLGDIDRAQCLHLFGKVVRNLVNYVQGLASFDIKVSTRAALESSWKVHVQPKWSGWMVSAIEQSHVRTWIAGTTSRGHSATTVKRAHGVLAGILDEAVRDRRILNNPCRGVKTPRKVSRLKTFLTHEQLHRLADASGDHRTMVLLMGYTGLRWGEVIALRIRDLNLVRRRIDVAENAVEVGATIHVGSPKTHERRSVAFPEFLSPLLQKQAADKLPDALLFPGSDGLHLRRTRTDANGKGWFAQAVRKAGVPRITPHQLRHTAASLAISAGANVKAVQAMLGHKSAAMTLDTYSGLFPDDLDAVADAMGRAGASFLRA